MGTALTTVGIFALLAVGVSLLWQFWHWRGLATEAKDEQRAIRRADRKLFRAQLDHRRRVTIAERKIMKAGLSPVRARYGSLNLHDDHVRFGGAEYPLTERTKVKVVGHGRGDQRVVMVLLEDTTWSSSLSSKKTGKPNEISAQQFASELRVRASSATASRAARNYAIDAARGAAAAERANTTALDAARATRDALGERHRGAGSAPPRGLWRPAALLLGLLAVLSGASAPPATTPGSPTLADASPTATETPRPTPTKQPASEMRAQARSLVNRGAYSQALSLTADLPKSDRSYVRRLVSARAAKIALRALARGDRSTANRALQNANAVEAPATEVLTDAKRAYAAANEQVASERRARRAVAAQREADRRAAEATAAIGVPEQEGNYTGMTCAEIGHSFSVVPGSDPDHDANNDGEACESY